MRARTPHPVDQEMSNQVAVGPIMARRAVVLLIGKALAILLSMLAAALIPRQLGPRGMGFYSYLYSAVFTLVCVLDAGGAMLLRRYVPEYLAHRRGQVRPLFFASLKAKLVVMAGFALVTPFVQDPTLFLLALAAAVCASMVDSVQNLLYAGGALVGYALVTAVLTGLRIALLLVLGPPLQRLGITVALVASSAITVALFLPMTMRVLPPSSERLQWSYWWFLRFGLVSYGADLAFVLSNRLALIVGRHALDDMAELGYLGLAFMVLLLARQLAFFIGETSIPSIVHYHATGEEAQFGRTMYHVWRYTNILVFGASPLLAYCAEPLVVIVVGEPFRKASLLIRLLVPAFVASTLTLCVRIAPFARGRAWHLLLAHVGALAAFLAVVGGCRIAGVAISGTTIATAFSLAAAAGLVLMTVGAHLSVPLGKLLLATFRPASAAAALWVGLQRLHLSGPWQLAAVAPGAFAYLVALFLVRGLEWRDWHRLLALVGRRPLEDAQDLA